MRTDEEDFIARRSPISPVKSDDDIFPINRHRFVGFVQNIGVKILNFHPNIGHFEEDSLQFVDDSSAEVQPVVLVDKRMTRIVKVFE